VRETTEAEQQDAAASLEEQVWVVQAVWIKAAVRRELRRASAQVDEAMRSLRAIPVLVSAAAVLCLPCLVAAAPGDEVAHGTHLGTDKAAKDKAAKDKAAKDQAAKDQAAKDQAAKDQAAKDQAAKDQAAKDQAAKDQAAKDQAAKDIAETNGTATVTLPPLYQDLHCDEPRTLCISTDGKVVSSTGSTIRLTAADLGQPYTVKFVKPLSADTKTFAIGKAVNSDGGVFTVTRPPVNYVTQSVACTSTEPGCVATRVFKIPAVDSFAGTVNVGGAKLDLIFTNIEEPALKKLFDDSNCSDPLVFCLDDSGQPLLGDEPPPPLDIGTHIQVLVIGQSGGSAVYAVTGTTVKSNEVLFVPRAAGNAAAPKQAEFVVLAKWDTDITEGRKLIVTFKKSDTGKPDLLKTYALDIAGTRYFLEIGLGLPFVYRGQRTLVANPVPGTGERTLGVQEDWSKEIALMLNFFPFGGRRKDVVWFASDEHPAASLIGFQLGHSLDLKDPLDRWYAGVVLEPIAGLSLNGGITLLTGEFVRGNQRVGMLLEPGDEPNPVREAMLRPYIGATLSLDIVDSIKAAVTSEGNVVKK
jgi:hypothetical protein